ncbi:MAG TPA: hypothetical protein VFD70_30975 [Anaerolineae bacterium]|nr:hypothetical protein [Anaerolineae bacterium]
MFKRRTNLPDAELRELYVNQGHTMTELALHYGVSETSVRRKLHEMGVLARPRGPKGARDLPHLGLDAATLRELYLERKLSIPQIAELLGWRRVITHSACPQHYA